MKRKRRRFSGEEKVSILRRHLVDRAAVSDLCEEHGISPTLFYQWQKRFFERGASAFEGEDRGAGRAEKRLKALEEKLRRKDEVLSELLEEHVKLKKSLGAI